MPKPTNLNFIAREKNRGDQSRIPHIYLLLCIFTYFMPLSILGYGRIHYTDYTYAVLDLCFSGLVNYRCKKSDTQVEIVSRHLSPIAEKHLLLIELMLSSNMCIKKSDLRPLSTGKYCIQWKFRPVLFSPFLPSGLRANLKLG